MFTQHHLHEEFHHHHHQYFLPCLPPPPLLPSSSSSTNFNNNNNNNNNNNVSSRPNILADRWKPNIEIAPNCPRCDSSNTKFCYYNNYSLTQPRYFCKGCRRYWTKGGSLRNVPVGGGCRKNRRGKSVRISSNHHRSTSPGNSPFGGSGAAATNSVDPLENNMDSTSRLDNSSSSADVDATTTTTTTTIDLALVYAKYLNQQPDSSSNNSQPDHHHQFSRDNMNRFDDSPSLDFSSINSEPIHETHAAAIHHQFSSSSSQEQCNMVALSSPADPSPETQLSTTTEGSQQQVFLGEVMELNHFNQQNESRLIVPPPFSNLEPNSCSGSYLLQPLLVPSEDPILQDHLWLNSPVLGSNNFSWHNQATTHLQGGSFEPMIDHHHSTFHSNPLAESSWSSFDLPSFEAFPRQ